MSADIVASPEKGRFGESLTSLMLPLSKDFGNAELWRRAWGALKGDNVPQPRRPSNAIRYVRFTSIRYVAQKSQMRK
jgi:hypothetical protein